MDDELIRSQVFRESHPTITAAVEWGVAFTEWTRDQNLLHAGVSCGKASVDI